MKLMKEKVVSSQDGEIDEDDGYMVHCEYFDNFPKESTQLTR